MMLSPLTIGPFRFENNLALAPMAGITDLPSRRLARHYGAGLVIGEMVAANPQTRHSRKSVLRCAIDGDTAPVIRQIVGNDPAIMAEAARHNVANGADIIDINMGCPAKKVCRKSAGSALLADEALVARLLTAVVQSVDAPVTLKIRTGIDRQSVNALQIARIAEDCGVQLLTIHGRTRADKFNGQAEYDTIADVCRQVSIPVLANGDIDSPEKARHVLQVTGAAGLMIGRAARGRPWIFREIAHFLTTGHRLPAPNLREIADVLLTHVRELHHFYGEPAGIRIARKHIGWYLGQFPFFRSWRATINQLETAQQQLSTLQAVLEDIEPPDRASASQRAVLGGRNRNPVRNSGYTL